MFKVMFFLWRRPDLTRRQFIEHYEQGHVPLSYQTVPPAVDFRRNYPLWDGPLEPTSVFGLPPFDGMTELFHYDRTGFEAQLAAVKVAPAGRRQAEGEGGVRGGGV